MPCLMPCSYKLSLVINPVRDFSKASVSIHPAEHASWSDARADLITEAKRPMKAKASAEIAAAPDEASQEALRVKYDRMERDIEHSIDHQPMEIHLALGVEYNFLSK